MKVKAEGCNISCYWQNLFCFVVLDGNEKLSKINCCKQSILSLTLFLTPPSFHMSVACDFLRHPQMESMLTGYLSLYYYCGRINQCVRAMKKFLAPQIKWSVNQ